MPEAGRAAASVTAAPPPQTLLGFDFGLRRIGVAVGQRVTGTATALTTLAARDGQPDWAQIARLLETWHPDALVVGLPLQLDGTDSEVTRAAQRFARRLEGRFHLPVFLHDERLSSHTAEQWLREHAGKLPAAGAADRVAAQVILQDWLDSQGD